MSSVRVIHHRKKMIRSLSSKKSDEYETPSYAWDIILEFIPKHYVIWEPFYCSGASGKYLQSKGFNVIHAQKNFFEWKPKFDVIVTNPPFSLKKEIINKLLSFERPFALILPLNILATQYFQDIFKERFFQIIVPYKRFSFIREGECAGRSSFDSVWICYGLEQYIGRGQQIFFR